MNRINTNVSSLVAQVGLNRANAGLQQAMDRLSSGLRINKGKDDPAGLIASETIRSDITAVNRAISNSQRAGQLIATADSALGQVSNLLNDIRGLITETANDGALSNEQIDANQLQVDSSLEAIDRIAHITTFQGRRLLDGNLDFVTTGVDPNQVTDLQIDQANFGTLSQIDVTVQVITQATRGGLEYFGGGGTVNTGDADIIVKGSLGSETISIADGAQLTDVAAQINLVSDATGVNASVAGSTLTLEASEYGSDHFVEVEVLAGAVFQTFGLLSGAPATREEGADVDATVNGVAAVGRGLNASINTSTLDLSITVDETVGDGTTLAGFSITDGGAVFQLGPDVVSNQQARLGIQGVNTATLTGGDGRLSDLRSGGQFSLQNDVNGAARVVEDVITKVVQLRGRLGAFERTTIDSNVAALARVALRLDCVPAAREVERRALAGQRLPAEVALAQRRETRITRLGKTLASEILASHPAADLGLVGAAVTEVDARIVAEAVAAVRLAVAGRAFTAPDQVCFSGPSLRVLGGSLARRRLVARCRSQEDGQYECLLHGVTSSVRRGSCGTHVCV